jgi:hypothetical protein
MKELTMKSCSASNCRLVFAAAILAAAWGLLQPAPLRSAESDTPATAGPLPGAGYSPQADPLAPITVGPREAVGKKSAARKVAGGLLGGVLGGSGGASSRSDRPKERRDPTRKQDYALFKAPGHGLETGARAAWTDDGLLVSTRIEDAEDKDTFQTVFLQTCDGRRLYPQRYEIYDLWAEGSLSVSWSKTSTVDGRVVGHETGGWSDAWTGDFGSLTRHTGGGLPAMPATWQQLGFDRAEGGARQLGSYFNLSPNDLAELGEVSLFAHTTLPGKEPVTTLASHWLLRHGADGELRAVLPNQSLVPGQGIDAGRPTAWQDWAERCEIVSPVLVAAAGAAPLVAVVQAADAPPAAHTGYPLPPGVAVSQPVGTGRTTGHIADINVRNDSPAPVTFPNMPFYIPATGKYQGYVGAPGDGTVVPPGTTATVPIEGYCGDVRRPPVPAGEPLPPVDEWIVPGDPAAPVTVPPREGAGAAGRVLIPGTDTPVPRVVDPDLEPLIAAPLLFGAIREIERVTAEMQDSGELQTPFSGNPEREREAVVQQTFWLFAAELEGEPYTREEFTQRLEEQHAERTGRPITAAPPEERERLQQGADDFWDAFELVGVEAKIISHPETAGDEPAGETQEEKQPPPAEPVKPACTPDEKIAHTPQIVDVKISDSYGNEDDRKKIRDGIKKSVEEAEQTYMIDTPPATAYALWGHDHIGGISSAYAKSVFLEANDQEWVWWTDPLTTTAKGTGTHTLSFTHGPECTSVVAGAALMWIKTTSEAFDPLEKNIEAFRTLDAVKEITVKYLADKLPPGLDEALEAGVEAITDPSSDTYAAATGSATLTVGADTDAQTSVNRVVYKREGKEDKAIVGGGETIKKLSASDVKPGSLTSKLDAEAKLEAGAQGNGFAKAHLESLYGTILIGVCECPAGTTYKITFDNGQSIRSEGAEEAVKRAIREMNEAAERIGKDIESGELEPTGEDLRARAESELETWGESIGGDRFEPEAAPESGAGND